MNKVELLGNILAGYQEIPSEAHAGATCLGTYSTATFWYVKNTRDKPNKLVGIVTGHPKDLYAQEIADFIKNRRYYNDNSGWEVAFSRAVTLGLINEGGVQL